MWRVSDLKLPLDHSQDALREAVSQRLGVGGDDLLHVAIARRAHDARRKRAIAMVYTVDVAVRDEQFLLSRLINDPQIQKTPDLSYRFGPPAPDGLASRPVVVGAGPCGLFAALILAQMGYRPIILDRGKVVRERTKDTWRFWRRGILDPESNVQFGEGGAGTFSDGKLYSQIKDPRHLGRKVLDELVKAGAPSEILTEARPHIGTFRLVKVVERLRQTIEALGGDYRFETRVDALKVSMDPKGERRIEGVVLASGEHLAARQLIMAIGHSARDTFQMLSDEGVFIEPKPFSIGFRVEHPQSVVDRARFGDHAGHPDLGAADYSLSHQASNGRTVYSFCMCPGGTVVAAASETGRVVTNGMSQYSRNERNANAALVVEIFPEDYPGHPLAGVELQRRWEAEAFRAGGGTYAAPAQRVGDFLAGRPSQSLGPALPSYRPGVTLTDLSSCLPPYAISALREAIPIFGRRIPGFDDPDAILTGVETRTSSPIRIRRDATFQSINTQGPYPAGEGAGYAGGILSAAVDGVKVAEAVAEAIATAALTDLEA